MSLPPHMLAKASRGDFSITLIRLPRGGRFSCELGLSGEKVVTLARFHTNEAGMTAFTRVAGTLDQARWWEPLDFCLVRARRELGVLGPPFLEDQL